MPLVADYGMSSDESDEDISTNENVVYKPTAARAGMQQTWDFVEKNSLCIDSTVGRMFNEHGSVSDQRALTKQDSTITGLDPFVSSVDLLCNSSSVTYDGFHSKVYRLECA